MEPVPPLDAGRFGMVHTHLVGRERFDTTHGCAPAYVPHPVLVGSPVPSRDRAPPASPRACIRLLLGGAPGQLPLDCTPGCAPGLHFQGFIPGAHDANRPHARDDLHDRLPAWGRGL